MMAEYLEPNRPGERKLSTLTDSEKLINKLTPPGEGEQRKLSGSFRDLKQLLSNLNPANQASQGPKTKIEDEALPIEVKKRTHKLCESFLGGAWKKVTTESLRLTRMKGGMSNMLFLCRLPADVEPEGNEPDKTLLRVYFNPETESHLVAESVIFTLLSERQLGPRLHGIFNGGRLEEYIVSRPLTCVEIRDSHASRRIARILARIHRLSVPIGKDPGYVPEALNRWFEHYVDVLAGDVSPITIKVPNGEDLVLTEALIWQEIDLIDKCMTTSKSPWVFCHNDLQEGNVLLPHVQGKASQDSQSASFRARLPSECTNGGRDLVFIDFEYASYNYRGFDFANHFCEWAIDYSEMSPPFFKITLDDFPNDNQQKEFFRAYLEASVGGFDNSNELEKCAESLVHETRPFVPVSHFFWGVWALLQVELSPVEFDFAGYSRQRLGYYFSLRHHMLELLKDTETKTTPPKTTETKTTPKTTEF